VEKGREQGLAQGRLEMLIELLDERFGPLAPETTERLRELSAAEVAALRKKLLRSKSLQELGLPN
jgi:hypothetical protein